MGKLKYSFIFLFAILFAIACDEITDSIPPGSFNYTVVNETEYSIRIITNPISTDEKIDTIALFPQDSFISNGYYWGIHEPTPFPPGAVFLVFDDSIKHECQPNLDNLCMVDKTVAYECVLDGPEVYSYRYALTDADYEYAKEHQYREEKSDE